MGYLFIMNITGCLKSILIFIVYQPFIIKSYVFFWVIPRRLKFICRSIGTLCLFRLHRQVGMKYHPSYLPAHEDGTDRVFRNDGIWNSDAGELPRRKHTTFKTRRKFEIKNIHKILRNNWIRSMYKNKLWFLYLEIRILYFCCCCDPTRVMTSSILRFLNHTQRRTTFGRTPLDEWSARRTDLYLTTHNIHDRHPCPRRESNPQSQQVGGRRPTP
jgi:hypothetical protein